MVAIQKRMRLATFSSVFLFLGCQSNHWRWLLFPVNIKEATASFPFSSPCRLKLQNSHEITDPELLLLSLFFFTNFCQGTTEVVGCYIETKEGNSLLVLSCALTCQLNQPKPSPEVEISLQSRRQQDLRCAPCLLSNEEVEHPPPELLPPHVFPLRISPPEQKESSSAASSLLFSSDQPSTGGAPLLAIS
uniref:Uncharacterized protein n=1 Tax=Lactuca sativa TaxID=4236 RepID=A0A9R1UW76_LACSA|nr:hypothetical protein LSAT_V11C800444900 [Lactuca sativa]